MEVGLLIRFGKFVPGREKEAIDLFTEASKYFDVKVKEGVLTYFEPYFLRTSDFDEETGFFILKGPAPEMFRLMDDDAYQWLLMKAQYVVDHLRADILTVGEEIYQQIERSNKARVELGI